MKNILVPIDFSEDTYQLLNKSVEIAEKFNSKVWIIHISSPEPDFVGYDVGPQYIRDFRAKDLRKEHVLIQTYADELKDKGVNCEGLLIDGATVEMILQETVKLNIDLVIIGQHKHNLLYKIFVDNVSIAVINKSTMPVLIIPLVATK